MSDKAITREEFLARCATAYDAHLIRTETLRLLDRWTDFVMRFEGGQMENVANFIAEESERLDRFGQGKTLAGDADGYALIQLVAILRHPCQACATDPKAWWTRAAFCPHRAPSPDPRRKPSTQALPADGQR